MAITKRAKYLFRVSEFSPEAREGAVAGTVRIAPVPFISAEYVGIAGERDVFDGSGFLSFDLHNGTTMEEAAEIVGFLNQKLAQVAVTTFGDVDDVVVAVENSEDNRQAVKDGVTGAIASLKDNLDAQNVPGAMESLEAVEGWTRRLLDDWDRTLTQFLS
jgi:hypothetical protein